MGYDNILNITKLKANLGQIKNRGVSFVVEYMFKAKDSTLSEYQVRNKCGTTQLALV